MWPLRRHEQADHLSRYWNALVCGAAPGELARQAAPVDAATLATIRHVRELRLTHRADQAFLDRLERDALAAFARTRTSSAGPPGTRRVSSDGTQPSSPPRWLPRVGRQNRRWVIVEL